MPRQEQEVVYTVLGPVPTEDLGIVLIHETLLSVIPGAELAPDIRIDRSEIFAILKRLLLAFREVGGKTIVDYSGMFHGRDVKMYETLSRTTGMHIIASTGLGPESMLSGYFLTPQKNPPIPWQAEQYADLFTKEVVEGIVVPRIERSGPAGMVTSIASRSGITEIETQLFRGSAQTAMATGVPVSIQYGADAVNDIGILLQEGVQPNRVIVGGLDRLEAAEQKMAITLARQGAMVAFDHVGWGESEGYTTDATRIELITELFSEGLGEQVLISTNAVGVMKGYERKQIGFDYLLTTFVPLLRQAGVTDEQLCTLLEKNPQRVLTVQKTSVATKETVSAANK